MSGKFVEKYLLFQLAVISQSLSSEFYDYLRSKGVSPARWRVLVNLIDGDMFVSELVKNTLFEQSRVTKIVDQLVKDNLVIRQPDKQDRRRVKVRLTNKGRDLTVPLIEAAKTHEASVLSELPPHDRETFRSTLRYFVRTHFKQEKATSHSASRRVA